MDLDYFIANVLRACEKKNVLPTIAFREAGIGQNFINNMKKGSFPSIEKVYKLTKYLGVTTSELLGEEVTTKEDASDTLAGMSRLALAIGNAFDAASPEIQTAVCKLLDVEMALPQEPAV